jgi:L-ribulose-5-phosphate 3-epimerase
MFQYGIRGHDFGKMPVADLAAAISKKGFTALQLALAKAVPDIDCGHGKLSTGLARHIAGIFSQSGINIAVMGCYVNLIHPDPAERKKGLERFKEHIRFVRDFGCSIVGTETGSVNADYSFNPANHGREPFEDCVRSVAELVEEAERFGAIVCIEAVTRHVVNTPKRMREMIDTIASNNLQVIFDPENLLNIENHKDQDSIVKESFDLFGDRIMVLHAKDYTINGNDLKVVPAGTGLLNYKPIVAEMVKRKPYSYVLFEDSKPEFVEASRDFFMKSISSL